MKLGREVKLILDQQCNAIWYKSVEPFFYNHIKHKEMSNKSGSVAQQGQFSQKKKPVRFF